MTATTIEEILRGAIGLNAASLGPGTVEQALRLRMSACRISDADDYLQRLQASSAELDELIEAILVRETWFFRHPESFAALLESIRGGSLLENPKAALRILSVPSSTGEEPYSIVMALLDGGISPWRFRVDAVDISQRALGQARRGIFGTNSFRSQDLGFRDRYFHRASDGYHLSEIVRDQVHFECANLLSPTFLTRANAYDVIFCRNVLIYFDRAAQLQAIAALDRALGPAGILFVGPAEGFLLMSCGFRSTLQQMAFGYRKPGLPHSEQAVQTFSPGLKQPAKLKPGKKYIPVNPLSITDPIPAAVPVQKADAERQALAMARQLADLGKLGEALEACEADMRVRGPSADACYLMGLLGDAMGNDERAREYHRRALYLDPGHLEAMAHLALLEEKGNTATASRLRNRMERMQEHSRVSAEELPSSTPRRENSLERIVSQK